MQSSDQRQQHERGGKKGPRVRSAQSFSFLYLIFFSFSVIPNVSHQRTSHPDTFLHASPPGTQRRRAPAPRLRPPGQQLPRVPQAIFQG